MSDFQNRRRATADMLRLEYRAELQEAKLKEAEQGLQDMIDNGEIMKTSQLGITCLAIARLLLKSIRGEDDGPG